jgi:hypothetical protein
MPDVSRKRERWHLPRHSAKQLLIPSTNNVIEAMNQPIRVWPLALLTVLVVLYGNVWMWDSDRIVFGLPINLLYHVGLCALASVAMLVVTLMAWPHQLDQD